MTRPSHVRLLTVAEAATLAKVGTRTISDWIRSGLLPSIKQGRYKLVQSDHLQQIMRDRYQQSRRRLPDGVRRSTGDTPT